DSLLRLGGLLGLDLPDEALALGLATDAIGLRLLDARGVRLDADPQREAEVERLLVRHAELLCELVHAHLRCQVLGSVLRGRRRLHRSSVGAVRPRRHITAYHPRTN